MFPQPIEQAARLTWWSAYALVQQLGRVSNAGAIHNAGTNLIAAEQYQIDGEIDLCNADIAAGQHFTDQPSDRWPEILDRARASRRLKDKLIATADNLPSPARHPERQLLVDLHEAHSVIQKVSDASRPASLPMLTVRLPVGNK